MVLITNQIILSNAVYHKGTLFACGRWVSWTNWLGLFNNNNNNQIQVWLMGIYFINTLSVIIKAGIILDSTNASDFHYISSMKYSNYYLPFKRSFIWGNEFWRLVMKWFLLRYLLVAHERHTTLDTRDGLEAYWRCMCAAFVNFKNSQWGTGILVGLLKWANHNFRKLWANHNFRNIKLTNHVAVFVRERDTSSLNSVLVMVSGGEERVLEFEDCTGCSTDYWQIIKDYHSNNEASLKHLRKHEVLPIKVNCKECNLPCKYREDRHQWYCGCWKNNRESKGNI